MHERRVRLTETARADLEDIVDFIAEDSGENTVAALDRL
jgi:plasmid stabilization system protein ParE